MRFVSFFQKASAVCGLCVLLASPAISAEHLVTDAALEQAVVDQSEARDSRVDKVQQALSDPRAENAIETLGFEPQQVREAVAQLDDETLAELAVRAEAALDPSGAALNNQQITYILIALVTAVVILVIVAAD